MTRRKPGCPAKPSAIAPAVAATFGSRMFSAADVRPASPLSPDMADSMTVASGSIGALKQDSHPASAEAGGGNAEV